MATRRAKSRAPRWLRHRHLIAGETLLLVGIANQLFGNWVTGTTIPNWGKVLFTMAGVLGIFGGLFLLLGSLTRRGVARTHDVVQALPLPLPTLLIHLVVYLVLFVLYARIWGFWPIM